MPNPEELCPVAVAITYWTLVFLAAVVFPKWFAAATASAASCDCNGCDGALLPSDQLPPRTPVGFVAWTPLVPQVIVPAATPWQYCVTELFQELPPTLLKKLVRSAASPDGSLDQAEPQNTR